MDNRFTVSIDACDLDVLFALVAPGSRCDRPGELNVGAFARRFSNTARLRLRTLGLIAIDQPGADAPLDVCAFYEEFMSRSTLRTPLPDDSYVGIVSITDLGWQVIATAVASGHYALPTPAWEARSLL